MRVTYQANKNLLWIDCSMFEYQHPRSLANRKLSTKHKQWIAPCVRMNAKIILATWFDMPDCEITPEAKAAIERAAMDKQVEKIPFPSNFDFKFPPYDFQKKGLDFTYSLDVCGHFVDMGLGKSKMALDKHVQLFLEGKINALLVMCPHSIRFNWVEQVQEHCKISAYKVMIAKHKTKTQRRELDEFIKEKTNELKILIIGTESVSGREEKIPGTRATRRVGTDIDIAYDFVESNRAAVVVDECHMIKNPNSARSKSLCSIAKTIKYRMIMTGTPISQGIMDLYSQMTFLGDDILGIGDFYSFLNRYAVMGGYKGTEIVGYQNIDELMDIIRPFIYQCRKEDVIDLPSKTFTKRFISLTKEQQEIYNELKKKRVALIPDTDDKRIVVKNILSLFGALQKVCGGFTTRETDEVNRNGKKIRETLLLLPINKNPKIKELKSIIDGLADTEQLIIWSCYNTEIEMIEEALEGYKTSKFERSCDVYNRGDDEYKQRVKSNMNEKKTRYFISTPNSGGMGLTMNTVAYVVYFSNNFSYLHRMQSLDRNHRIGQKRPVTYIDIMAEKTVDEKVLGILHTKKSMADFVSEALDNKSAADIINEL